MKMDFNSGDFLSLFLPQRSAEEAQRYAEE